MLHSALSAINRAACGQQGYTSLARLGSVLLKGLYYGLSKGYTYTVTVKVMAIVRVWNRDWVNGSWSGLGFVLESRVSVNVKY